MVMLVLGPKVEMKKLIYEREMKYVNILMVELRYVLTTGKPASFPKSFIINQRKQ